MASFEVEMSSCPTFNCVLSHQHNNNNNNKKKKTNVHNIHVKNLNVFVRDHLDNVTVSNDISSSENSSVFDNQISKTEESQLDPDPNPGQTCNVSRKETMAASSLVQIWEARTTQQPPSIDSRTSSSGSNVLENSESLNEESLIQPIEEGNNEEEDECDFQFVLPPLPPEKNVRVMDIIRKLSNDSETTVNNENGNDNSTKEVQTTEVRCFPQVASSPRIRGRQAFADLLEQMIRDREKELASLLERHAVSKFTYRGRIQSTLRIRCYERCIAIQDRHRCKPSSAGSDLNRSPQRSGAMYHFRGKYKTNTENIETGASSSSVSSRGRHLDNDAQKAIEKKVVLQETLEKSDLKEIQEVIPTVENSKKAVLSDTVENKNGFKRETVSKETMEGRGEKRDTKDKTIAKEIFEWRGENRDTKEKEKPNAKESLDWRNEKREAKEKPNAKENLDWRSEKRDAKDKVIAKESLEGRGEKRETKEKGIAKESVGTNAMIGIAEKVNLWNPEEKMNVRRGMEKGKTEGKGNNNKERVVEKNDVLEEATRRITNVESAERSVSTTSKETMTRFEFGEKVVRRKNKEDCVTVKCKSKEIEDRIINPQEVSAQAEEKVLKEKIAESDSKKPIEKESSEEKRETEENENVNILMGIAEKVSMWNSKEKKNGRRVMEKGKGKADTDTDEVLQEASRRLTNVETAERSIASSKEPMEKVVGSNEMNDRRESSRKTTLWEEVSRIKRDEYFASIEARLKEIIEDKIMNLQEITEAEDSASYGSRERAKEKKSSQHGEDIPLLPNLEAESSKETERNNAQVVTQQEESTSNGSREKAKSTKEIDRNNSQEASTSDGSKEKISLQAEEMLVLRNPNDYNGIKESEDEDTKMVEHEETGENDWDENEMEEEEDEFGDYYDYNLENAYDWFNDISRPRSYWEDLRKERYLEVLNAESEKKDICNLIQSRTVSNFLTSALREKIDNLMITRVHGHTSIQTNQEDEDVQEEEEEWEGECSARNREDNETEEEPEKTNLDACSQSSSWSFKDQEIGMDHEPIASLDVPEPSVPMNQSTQEMQMISDLRGQMEQLQREMFELRNTVKSCIDMQLHFQKSVTQDVTRPEQRADTKNDPVKRKCCICSENPVDSLLYRCGHMCTCLKCAHELQWSSKKCPICMAPIVDVVRAFLDS